MSSEHVSRAELKAHLEPLNENLRTFSRHMETLAKESSETRTQILSLVTEQTTRLDNHADQIKTMRSDVKTLNTHMDKTSTLWKIIGTTIVILSGAVLKLIFG